MSSNSRWLGLYLLIFSLRFLFITCPKDSDYFGQQVGLQCLIDYWGIEIT